ncbi:MAG: hypothetical protein WA840_19390 [Caulobacteraceae bacterium]
MDVVPKVSITGAGGEAGEALSGSLVQAMLAMLMSERLAGPGGRGESGRSPTD